jgi:chorismate mutase
MSSTETGQDAYVQQVRRQISDVDSALVDLVNKRLKLVSQLKRYKDEHGIGFVDLAREEWMLQYLQRANRGPLSEAGLSELYHQLLDLMKREVTAQQEGQS